MTSHQKTRDIQIVPMPRRPTPGQRGLKVETPIITHDESYEVFLLAGGFSG